MSMNDYKELREHLDYLVGQRERLYDLYLLDETDERILEAVNEEINYVCGMLKHYDVTHS